MSDESNGLPLSLLSGIGKISSSGWSPFILLTFAKPPILISGSNAVVDNPIGELSNGGDVSNGGQHNSCLFYTSDAADE